MQWWKLLVSVWFPEMIGKTRVKTFHHILPGLFSCSAFTTNRTALLETQIHALQTKSVPDRPIDTLSESDNTLFPMVLPTEQFLLHFVTQNGFSQCYAK